MFQILGGETPASNHARTHTVPKRRRRVRLQPFLELLEGRALMASFQGLAPIAGYPPYTSTSATAISSNGSVVVGISAFATRWDSNGVASNLTDANGQPISQGVPTSVSSDGSKIAGQQDSSSAFLWPPTNGNLLPSGLNPDGSNVTGMSADGSVLVGENTSNDLTIAAYRWSNGVLQVIDQLEGIGNSSHATGVSENGADIVGIQGTSGRDDGFYWTSGGLILFSPIGTNTGLPETINDANAISPDGTVVVGNALEIVNNNSYVQAFQWTPDGRMGGKIQLLGPLPSGFLSSTALAASSEGQVIVGSMGTDSVVPNATAFIWTPSTEYQNFTERLHQ